MKQLQLVVLPENDLYNENNQYFINFLDNLYNSVFLGPEKFKLVVFLHFFQSFSNQLFFVQPNQNRCKLKSIEFIGFFRFSSKWESHYTMWPKKMQV